MDKVVVAPAGSRVLLSGNEAVARAVWEAGTAVAAAYPGTPSTEILENIALYPDVRGQWAVNEKVSLEVAIGASMSGARAMCALKHVGLNVASDALMTLTLCGVVGGLVIVVCDDVGMSSSQNEQDSRYWGRFAHLPVLEPADSREAHAMVLRAFEISEDFEAPVLVRMTTRVCHVKGMVELGQRRERPIPGFEVDPTRWVMTPNNARKRLPVMAARDRRLAEYSETCDLNVLEEGADRSLGFIASGPAYMHVREAFPEAPVLKLGLGCPLPVGLARRLADKVERLVVVEETEPLVENELRAAGLEVHGKDLLPASGELTPEVLKAGLAGDGGKEAAPAPAPALFPRPPTLCAACPHLSIYCCLARLRKKVVIAGDIGCYTLGAGHPWQALDTTISMGASMGVAQGLDLARGEAGAGKAVVAVIGDSTFLHMGMQGLLNIVYNRANVTVLLLDNRAVGMTGGQDHPGTGRDLYGAEAPRIDFAALARALGVAEERVHVVDPYRLPELYKVLRREIAVEEPSVIVTDRPCVLIGDYRPQPPLKVVEDDCTGCANCLAVGCPAIVVTRREVELKKGGREAPLAFVKIESAACTGCGLCIETCPPKVIVPLEAA